MRPFLNTKIPLLAALALGAVSPALAQTPANTETRLTFASDKTVSASPDFLTLDFAVETKASSAANAQDALNKAVASATRTLKERYGRINGLKIEARDYYAYQDSNAKGAPKWAAHQTLSLSAPVAQDKGVQLLQAAGALQNQDILLQNVNWSLDPKTRTALTQRATREALEELGNTARTDANALGLKFRRFADVVINPTNDNQGPRPMLMAARAAKYADPQATPSDVNVTVTIQAEAILGE